MNDPSMCTISAFRFVASSMGNGWEQQEKVFVRNNTQENCFDFS